MWSAAASDCAVANTGANCIYGRGTRSEGGVVRSGRTRGVLVVYAIWKRPIGSEPRLAVSTSPESDWRRSDARGVREEGKVVGDRGVTFLQCSKVIASERSVRAKRHEFRRLTDLVRHGDACTLGLGRDRKGKFFSGDWVLGHSGAADTCSVSREGWWMFDGSS